LDVRKLQMLAELERLGTIAAAAQALHLTAPGVSMQLAALEREVGLSLTERRGRRVALTPAGQLLARHGRDIVDRVGVAAMEVAALREGIAGTYRVAAFPTAARSFVAQVWRHLVAEPASGPALRLVELEPLDSLPALAAGEVDLAVTHSYSNLAQVAHPGVESTQIAREEVFLAVPRTGPAPPRPGQHPVEDARLADYAGHGWIVPHRRWSCYEMVERACGLAGFAPQAVAEATDFSTQLALVAAGVGVALIPDLGCVVVPEQVMLCRLAEPVHRHLHLATRRGGRADPGLARLAGLLRDTAGTTLSARAGRQARSVTPGNPGSAQLHSRGRSGSDS
jgi:DNA-binding transcriptional LysR family regulator